MGRLREAQKEIERLRKQIEDLERTFDLRWKADMRATKMWRKEHPEKGLYFPDHADLCCWLIGLLKERNQEIRCLRKLKK